MTEKSEFQEIGCIWWDSRVSNPCNIWRYHTTLMWYHTDVHIDLMTGNEVKGKALWIQTKNHEERVQKHARQASGLTRKAVGWVSQKLVMDIVCDNVTMNLLNWPYCKVQVWVRAPRRPNYLDFILKWRMNIYLVLLF